MPSNYSGYRSSVIASILLSILFFSPHIQAQYKLNYGLGKPQDKSTFPQSRAAYIQPVLKAKTNTRTILKPAQDGAYIITNGWELAAGPTIKANGKSLSKPGYNTRQWYNAVVPGTVLSSLVKQGVYADPYFGLNNLHIPDSLCRQDWWYRTSFKIPAGHKKKHVFFITLKE